MTKTKPGDGQLSLFGESPRVFAGVPPILRHPNAQRELRLGVHRVAYELRRGRRRSIGFVVGSDGLSVSAPRWVNVGQIESALREKTEWILRKLAEQQERTQRLLASRVDWRDGASIPFLGAPVIVTLDAYASGSVLQASLGAPRLVIGLPRGATREQIRDAVQGWLKRQARRVFEERCAHFASRLGVTVTRLALSSARTRWGSANADGSIRLHWRLVHFALPIIDYVVAHELAHLRHMDHSPRFWDVVRSVVPDYEAARANLSDDSLPVLD